MTSPRSWLPPGKTCAILFSIDDVHPAGEPDGGDAGGDLESGVLGRVAWLAERHAKLRTSLCVTPDWRPRVSAAGAYASQCWPEGRMRIDRHPQFVTCLKSIPRAEFVPHGLHHVARDLSGPAEFADASYEECRATLSRSVALFRAAGLEPANGHSPPGWSAPPALRAAMRNEGLAFLASARDVVTPVTAGAVTAMSGLAGQPLAAPGLTAEALVHIPVNFQATSAPDRAFAILEAGGLLSIKAHAIKRAGAYVALDGLDAAYAEALDRLLGDCEDRLGEQIWWASMSDIATRAAVAAQPLAVAAA